MQSDGGQPSTATQPRKGGESIAFPRPDGTRIAFTSDGTEDNGEIYVKNSDGSGLTQLTDDPAYDSFPAWRP